MTKHSGLTAPETWTVGIMQSNLKRQVSLVGEKLLSDVELALETQKRDIG